MMRNHELRSLFFVLLFALIPTAQSKDLPPWLGNKKVLFCIWSSAVALQKPGEQISKASCRLRGSSVYKVNLYKKLLQAGVNAVALVINDNDLKEELELLGNPCYGCQSGGMQKSSLATTMKMICEKEDIALIHCHIINETVEAIAVAQEYPVKIVRTLHVDSTGGDEYLRRVNGIMCVSPKSMQLMEKSNKEKRLNIKHITWTPPFFDEDRFLDFVPTEDKKTFFKREFNADVKDDCPLICSVANFYPLACPTVKNHTVLLRAVALLLKEYHLPVQLALAGIGPRLDEMKQLAVDLGIEKNVFFVGHTTKTPELYYYSDINALTSDIEPFGIVLLEGALLKKPLIGTAGTGMEAVVKHGQTGFVFEKNNAKDLAAQFARLLTDKNLAQALGSNACAYVKSEFLSDVNVQKVVDFYDAVLQ